MIRIALAPLAAMAVIALAACDSKPAVAVLPEVNEANCQLEKIKQIPDEEARREFGSRCFRRSVTQGHIEAPLNWLTLMPLHTSK